MVFAIKGRGEYSNVDFRILRVPHRVTICKILNKDIQAHY
jgi:hypothetical protein